MQWTDVALAYSVYMAALALLVPRFAAARRLSVAAVVVAIGLWWVWPGDVGASGVSAAVWVVVPSLSLLAAYRVSGAFFVHPSLALERALLAVDRALLGRSGLWRVYSTAAGAAALFELFYVLVYVVLPLGAVALVVSGQRDALRPYWSTVFLAELICYAALPWLQTRPPRVLEGAATLTPPPSSPLRRLNLFLLRHGSIQANTVPSAHAAGAVAVALEVYSAAPELGLTFALLAAGITLSTVLGRYHYALDSALGVAVALLAWRL